MRTDGVELNGETMKDRWILSMKDLAVLLICVLFLGGTLGLVGITGQEHAKRVVCMANLEGLGRAWLMLAQDNNGTIVRPNQNPDRWVDRPHQIDPVTGVRTYTGHDSTLEEKINGIKGGLLFAYAGRPAMYHCPSDGRSRVPVNSRGVGAYRTYSIPGGMGGWPEYGTVSISGLGLIRGFQRYGEIAAPAEKYVFVEDNYTHSPSTPASEPPNRGYNSGVWSFWRSNLSEAWWDPVAAWHDDGMNLGFADGHAAYRRWVDQRTVWFANDRLDPRLGSTKNECALQPGNPDQQYMTEHYPFRFVE